MNEMLIRISDAVYDGQVKEIAGLTQSALTAGVSPKDILDKGLLVGMDLVGVDFKSGRKFVPEVMLAARTMQTSLDILKPRLAETGATLRGKVLIATVKGDLHDIGKNLVGMMMRGAGFEVVDLGKDIAPEKFVEAVWKEQPHILAMSALLTTTMRSMGDTVEAIEDAGLRDKVKIMVGGAPVTADFAKHIGADAYAPNAPMAAALAKEFVGVTL